MSYDPGLQVAAEELPEATVQRVYEALWYDVAQSVEELAPKLDMTTYDTEAALLRLCAERYAKKTQWPDGPWRYRRGSGI